MKKIRVVELFAGVGGFRLGLEKFSKDAFDFVFANQWEPNKTKQHAYDCYVSHFGAENTSNVDISIAKYDIPDNIDLLVGGFPCQDYSVAATKAKGIQGKKGVLWWEISWILENKKPKTVLLENVDRLLKSPSAKRGRDFAIMLFNMYKLGYDVEWRVINAADYNMVQRRKRIFIFAKRRDTFLNKFKYEDCFNNRLNYSFFEGKFPTNFIPTENKEINLKNNFIDEYDITINYNLGKFLNAGFCIDGIVYQSNYEPNKIYGNKYLKSILQSDFEIDDKYWLKRDQLEKMKFLKGSKKIQRTGPDGNLYYYSEGQMSLYDDVNSFGRTMLTSEGTINRSSHIIKEGRRYRFITPIEAERLNGFPDNWTLSIGTDRMRYFCMGNALVIDLIELMANRLVNIFNEKEKNNFIGKTTITLKL